MARCAGCSSTDCNCHLAAGDGIELTGVGSELSPWVISATDSGGGGGPFLIVASNTTSDDRKAIANYVCDGTADQVQINQAVLDLTSANGGGDWGGTVYLLEGEYYTSAPIDLNYSVNLQGAGYNNTWIYFDGNGDAGPRTGVGNPYGDDYVIIKPGEGGTISDLYINQFDNSGTGFRGGIRLDGERSMALRVKIELDSNPGVQPIQNSAIRLNGIGATLKDSWIEAWDGTGVDGGSDQREMKVENNFIGASLGIDGNGTPRMHIVNNILYGGGEIGATFADYDDPQFDFVYGNGIVIWAGPDDPSIVMGNRIEDFSRCGIVIDEAQHILVSNNIVHECSQAVINTWSGIWIRVGNYGIHVEGNMVRGEHKYGIEIGTDAFNTIVVSNDLLESGNTGAFFDGGTDTSVLGGNYPPILLTNRRTANYTLVLSDANRVVEMNVAGANNLTVPPNGTVPFPIGTILEVLQYGAGQTTFVPGVGVTIRSPGSKLKIAAQYGGASLRKIGTNEWALEGNLTA